MIECSCGSSDVEFTVVKDVKSGVILLEANCKNCGRRKSSFGTSVEQALKRVTKKWSNS